jgi:hypothetical protein
LPSQILAGRQAAEGKDFLDTPPYAIPHRLIFLWGGYLRR